MTRTGPTLLIKRHPAAPRSGPQPKPDAEATCSLGDGSLFVASVPAGQPSSATESETFLLDDARAAEAAAADWLAERGYDAGKFTAWFAQAARRAPLSPAERVRLAEERKRSQGLKEIRVWVPDDPSAIAELRNLAARLVERHQP